MEPGPQHHAPDKQTNGKSRKKERWEDEINDFLKRQESEETIGNEIQKQRHLDKSGKNRERWRAMESEYAETAATASVDSVHSRRNPPKDPVRPVRYLNGVKLEEYEVANIALPHTKDQYDIDDTAADTAYEAKNKTKHQRIEAWKGLLSSNHLDDRVCRTFPWDFTSLGNESVHSAALFKFSFLPGTHVCRRDYLLEFNRICHSNRLMIFLHA